METTSSSAPGGDTLPTVAGIDLSALSAPVSSARPAGMPFDQEIAVLEQKAAPPSSLIAGREGTALPDQRNWTTIRSDAFELLARSRNLKAALLLTQALLRTDGWCGLTVGLTAFRLLLQHHWPHLYPLPAEDGDPYPRLNVLAELTTDEMLAELRKASVLGPMRLRELLDPKTTTAELESRYLAAKPAEQDAPARAVAELRAIATLLSQKDAALDLDPIVALGEQAAFRVLPLALKARGREARPVQAAPSVDTSLTNGAAQPAPPSAAGVIRSSDDVIQAIEKICEYYETHDRSSPVPMLLLRAKKLVNLTFLEAVKELADKGVPQVELLVGPEKK